MNPYKKILSALSTAKIDYLVVGGVAMNFLGYPRFTGDIDILLALDARNLKKMERLLKKMNYSPRVPVTVEELGDEKKMLGLIKKKNLIALTFINDKQPQFNIDVVVGESFKFDLYKKNRIVIHLWDVAIPVISIDDLIKMKRKSGRMRDVEDVAILLELKRE